MVLYPSMISMISMISKLTMLSLASLGRSEGLKRGKMKSVKKHYIAIYRNI